MINVAVSILTYNGNNKTIKTISDILSQKYDNIKVRLIVIDNNSQNKIVHIISEIYPDCKIIVNKSNLGFSGGNNIAIALARKYGSDFLFILNDDIRLNLDYIQLMVNIGIESTKVSAIGSTIILKDGTVQAVSGSISPFYIGVKWNQKKSNNYHIHYRKVDVIQGAAFMLTKAMIEEGFIFDECLFFGGEEYDLGCWSKKNGFKIYVLENVEVIHDTNQIELIKNRWHPDPTQFYYAIRNSIYVKKKYENNISLYAISLFIYFLRNALKGIFFYFRGNRNVTQAIFKGMHDGFFKKMGKLERNF